MNIDSVTRLIESAPVQEFRTLSALFLDLIGLSSATYCDGPYDGGKDFFLSKNPAGVDVGIQLSVEKDWRRKIEKDAKKVRDKYSSSVLYFISSRRVPEDTFNGVRQDILNTIGVTVIRYDNQAIASEIIKNNKLIELLEIFGIPIDKPDSKVKRFFGAKNEAIASLLVFGTDVKEFRKGIIESVVKSELSRHPNGIPRNDLVSLILNEYKFPDTQKSTILSQIDRLLQNTDLVSIDGKISLAACELSKYEGLRSCSEYEYQALRQEVDHFLSNLSISIDDEAKILILDNLLELAVILTSNNFESMAPKHRERDVYVVIRDALTASTQSSDVNAVFTGLAEIISNTDFAKKIAAAELYRCLLNTNSNQLIGALGGSEGLIVYIDSSVFIPMLCGLLFEPLSDRSGMSGSLLFKLIKGHKFTAVIADVYAEEVAAHLIEACRDYKELILTGEDLSYSGNAFVSHYSGYSRSKEGSGTTFDEYVRIFGVRLSSISHEMSDQQFYGVRDRLKSEIIRLSGNYGLEVAEIPKWKIDLEIEQVESALSEMRLTRPPVLVRHDAGIIKHLSSLSSTMMSAQVLCTWDNVHRLIAPGEEAGYHVLNPVAVIDLFSIARNETINIPLVNLIDFAKIQTDSAVELSSKIWDQIVSIEKGQLSDGKLILSAREFKDEFIATVSNVDDLDMEEVSKAWLAWKNSSANK